MIEPSMNRGPTIRPWKLATILAGLLAMEPLALALGFGAISRVLARPEKERPAPMTAKSSAEPQSLRRIDTSPPSSPASPRDEGNARESRAFVASLSLNRNDGRLYAEARYTFCFSTDPLTLEVVNAHIKNLSADWLNVLLFAPQVRALKTIPGGYRNSAFAASIWVAAKKGRHFNTNEITLPPGQARAFTFEYAKNRSRAFTDLLAAILEHPNPTDSETYNDEGAREIIVLPNGEDGTPVRIWDLHPAPSSSCRRQESASSAARPRSSIPNPTENPRARAETVSCGSNGWEVFKRAVVRHCQETNDSACDLAVPIVETCSSEVASPGPIEVDKGKGRAVLRISGEEGLGIEVTFDGADGSWRVASLRDTGG